MIIVYQAMLGSRDLLFLGFGYQRSGAGDLWIRRFWNPGIWGSDDLWACKVEIWRSGEQEIWVFVDLGIWGSVYTEI